MKITVYTTADCQFSKAEKEYLTSHSLQYEEKNLETNKEFLTEMLAVSNNFAGTPVTRVEKDDGTIAVLKGFTKEEFDTTFGISAESPKTEEQKPVEEAKPEETSPVPTSTPQPTVVEPPKEEPKSDELNAVINKLEEKTETPPVNPPTIPDFSSDVKTTA
ncbi:MAG: glutaredoxin domain-containing protein [Candidatus Roizmanbacteria bacterium]